MIAQRFTFINAEGHELAAVLDRPAGEPRAYALFAHCFTCGKDVLAARRIAAGLVEHGWGVVRFDFTGLGGSEGELSGFLSHVDDVRAAVDAMRARGWTPSLLIGHSWGGTAVLAAAEHAPEAVAFATVGSPADPAHVLRHLEGRMEEIETAGASDVTLADRPFRITRDFVRGTEGAPLLDRVRELGRALFIFHAPDDDEVPADNAAALFRAARHPKSFISLDGADHLLTRAADAAYVAHVLAAGVERYLPGRPPDPAGTPGEVVVAETRLGKFQQSVTASGHRLHADEPEAVGGTDTGPSPYDLLLAAVGACAAMTVRLYADRKGWPLEQAEVRLRHDRNHFGDCRDAEGGDGRMDRISRTVILRGPLDDGQRARLLGMAERCPVHRTLEAGVRVETSLAPREP